MKKLLPLVLLLVGAGAGVGAGIFLRPEAAVDASEAMAGREEAAGKTEDHGVEDGDSEHAGNDYADEGAKEYVQLRNQFVVPIVKGGRVTALVVLALSIEVPAGQTEKVFLREPKLRDSFLQILFDHANVGGFEGNFTDAQILGRLRDALREVAERDLGKALAKDVLIVEIARQDY